MRRTKKFDDGGLASSGSQPAFGQQRSAYPSSPSGLGNNAPLVQIGSTAPAQAAPTLFGQAAPQQTQMKRGGKVKAKTNFAKGGKVRKYAVGGAMTPRAPVSMATPRPAVPTPNPQAMSAKLPTQMASSASAAQGQRQLRHALPTPNPQAMSVAPRPTSIAPRPTAPAPTYSDPMAPYKTEEPMYTGFDEKQVYKRQKELDRYREQETSDVLKRIRKHGNNPMPVGSEKRIPDLDVREHTRAEQERAQAERAQAERARAEQAKARAEADYNAAKMAAANLEAARRNQPRPPPQAVQANTPMKKGGMIKGYKKGGSIDGIAKKGKTKTQHFAKGGRVDGCAVRGKTNCKMR